ncbi:hypothetical protein PMAYCL1PPCAC_01211, partial [Pristionchus mayeri]
SPHSRSSSSAFAGIREWMSASRAYAESREPSVSATGASPRRNTAGEEAANGTDRPVDDGNNSNSRPRGSSSGALGAATVNAISTTPKKGGLLSGLRNPMVALKASSDGEGSSNRDGSSEGGASPSDENETRARLEAKINAAVHKLALINQEKERELDEFYAMSNKVEAAGGRDTPHMARIKQHFDKKNKKSTALADAVQKKLAGYEARLADLNGGGSGAAPDPHKGHTVIQNIRRMGANAKQMTSTVVSAPYELAQKLKRGTMGNSIDPADGELLGHSQFYPSSASRSTSGVAPSSQQSSAPAKPKSATLPANMRMSPVDLEAAAAAAAPFPSGSSNGTSPSMEWPKRREGSGRRADGENRDRSSEAKKEGSSAGNEHSLARLPPLGSLLAEKKEKGGPRKDEGRPLSPDIVQFTLVPRTSITPGNTDMSVSEQIAAMFDEMKQLRQHNRSFVQHMDKLQEKVQHELAAQQKTLAEERFRFDRLEENLNEFIELHQAETSSLKHELQVLIRPIAMREEGKKERNESLIFNLELIASRIDYQYNDRFKKVEENLESTQNHMFRVENSLRSSLEVKEGGPWFNALLLSGATILVELLKIGLYLTAVVLDFFRPFTGTRTKAGFFLLVLFLSFFLLQNAGWIVGLFSSNSGAAANANSTGSAASTSLSSIINATHSAAAAAGQTPPPAAPVVQQPPNQP